MIMREIASGIIESHTRGVRVVCKKRRDAMLKAFADEMPDDVTWTPPAGGMFIWVTLPENIDATLLLKDAVGKARVAFAPGAALHPDRSSLNTLRLSFSLNEPEILAEGIRRLARLIEARQASQLPSKRVQAG